MSIQNVENILSEKIENNLHRTDTLKDSIECHKLLNTITQKFGEANSTLIDTNSKWFMDELYK